MTVGDAAFLASRSLPLNRELLKVKPIRRPDWLSNIPEQCCEPDAPIETLTRKMIKPGLGSAGMRPVHLEIPIDLNVSEFGNLSVRAALVSDDFVPDPTEDSYASAATGWILRDGISFTGPMNEADPLKFATAGLSGSSIPICVDVWPLPSGFWHNDYFQLGISLPGSFHFSTLPDIACNANSISLVSDGVSVGRLSIWHDHWTPMYPKGGNTRCGMLTELRESDLALSREMRSMGVGWFAKLRLWRRKTDYGDFDVIERQQFFRDVA